MTLIQALDLTFSGTLQRPLTATLNDTSLHVNPLLTTKQGYKRYNHVSGPTKVPALADKSALPVFFQRLSWHCRQRIIRPVMLRVTAFHIFLNIFIAVLPEAG